MDRVRVIVYDKGLMMRTVVETLSSHQEDIEVIGIQAGDPGELQQALDLYQPIALIVSRYMPAPDQKKLASLLTDYPLIKLILFSPDDNWLRVYQRQDVLIKEPGELLKMVLNS